MSVLPGYASADKNTATASKVMPAKRTNATSGLVLDIDILYSPSVNVADSAARYCPTKITIAGRCSMPVTGVRRPWAQSILFLTTLSSLFRNIRAFGEPEPACHAQRAELLEGSVQERFRSLIVARGGTPEVHLRLV